LVKLDELERPVPGARDELDEQIDVALGARLATDQGTEDGQGLHAVALEGLPIRLGDAGPSPQGSVYSRK